MKFLQFSMHFTRLSIFTQDLEETNLQTGPPNSQIGHQDANLDCNWVAGAMAGGGSSIPARGMLDSAGKGRGMGWAHLGFHSVGCWWRRSSQRRCSATPGDGGRKELLLLRGRGVDR
jgi:hypothetical protein